MQRVALVFMLVVAIAAAGDMFNEKKKFMKFAKKKTFEQCYGEDVMKTWIFKWKKAMQTCSNTEMPEMDLPMFKSPYRMVQALLTGARDTERAKLMKLLSGMVQEGQQASPAQQPQFVYYPLVQQPQQISGQKDEQDMMFMKMFKKIIMKKMMKKAMKDKNVMGNPFGSDDDDDDDDTEGGGPEALFRNLDDAEIDIEDIIRLVSANGALRRNRRATDAELYDLGDSLNKKLKMQQEKWQAKLGNYSCVLKELDMVDEEMNLKIEKIMKLTESIGIEDQWFLGENRKINRMCYALATNLPDEILDDCFSREWAKIKHFMSCCEKQKMKLCMMKDIKAKLEENFKPLDELVEETGMEEKVLLPLAYAMVSSQFEDM